MALYPIYPFISKDHETGNIFANEYFFVRNESCKGKKYSVKGLFNFLRTPEINHEKIDISQDVRNDLKRYKEHLQRKKNSQEELKKRKERATNKTLETRV